jgi:D-glycero-D-manno-heptose 1,7-bisphosphate phosphatase
MSITETPADRPVAFLDRDGVINVDTINLHLAEDCQWIPGAAEAIGALNRAGYWVAIVTNQSGIGRGLFSEDQFLEFSNWYLTQLRLQGAIVDELLYCPHHPTEALGDYLCECTCRKPQPGMLLKVLDREGMARAGSFLIGDKPTDIQAAHAAGIPGYLFEAGNLNTFIEGVLAHP